MREYLSAGFHEVIVDGVRQSYFVAGRGPLCLVHSGGPGLDWSYLRMPELEKFLTLVYVEPVGSGGSGMLPDGDYSVQKYSYFCARLLQHLGVPGAHFIGHSHGGFVALQFALENPDRVTSLVLYGTAPVFGPELTAEATRKVDEFAARRPGHPEAAQVVKAWQQGSGEDRATYLDWFQRMLPIYIADYDNQRERLAAWAMAIDVTIDPGRKPYAWDVRDRLSSVTPSTLVIVGEEDFICGTRWSQELAAGLPDAQLVVMPATGHLNHVEKPESFADEVLDFVIGAQHRSS